MVSRQVTHGGRPAEAYRHKYIIADSGQVLPQYLVQFTFTPSANGDARPCDVCEENLATLFCSSDNAYLCDDCDVETHSANKLVSCVLCVCMRWECQWKWQ